jgi:predicted chitinase
VPARSRTPAAVPAARQAPAVREADAQGQGPGVGPRARGMGNAARQEDLRAAGPATGLDADAAARLAQGAPTGPAGAVDELFLDRAITMAVAAAPKELAENAGEHIPILLRQAAHNGIKDPNQAAYLLATAEHESKFGQAKYARSESLVEDRNPFQQRTRTVPPARRGQRPQTVTDFTSRNHVNGRQVSAPNEEELETRYWDSAYGGRLENERGTTDASRFRGRGHAQITGRTNYRERSDALNEQGHSYRQDGTLYGGGGPNRIDLLANPEHVNKNPDLAAQLLVTGARDGSFTNRSLEDYIPEGGRPDFVNARRVINGDTAQNGESIAAIARRYATALAGSWPRVFRSQRDGGPR